MEQLTFTDEQKVNLKRLAEAMRAGAALRPQGFSSLFNQKWVSTGVKTYVSCALGAAWEGEHPDFNAEQWVAASLENGAVTGLNDVEKYFGLTPRIPAVNPYTAQTHEITGIIIDLNDLRRWTREQIADWLLTLVQ